MNRAEEVNELLDELYTQINFNKIAKPFAGSDTDFKNNRVEEIKGRLNELTKDGKDAKNIFPSNGGMYPNIFANN